MSIVFFSPLNGATIYESLLTEEGVRYLTTVLAGTANPADIYTIRIFDAGGAEIDSSAATRSIGSTVINSDTVVYLASFNIAAPVAIHAFELWSSGGNGALTHADMTSSLVDLIAGDLVTISERICLFRNDNDKADSALDCTIPASVSSPII